MQYSKWESAKNMEEVLTKVDVSKKQGKTGIQLMYKDSDTLYIDASESSNLIIAGTGSGKTQSIMLPTIKLAASAGENIIVNDIKGEIYKATSSIFKEEGYDIKVINLSDANLSNGFNPLIYIYDIYQTNKDRAVHLIENAGYYFLYDQTAADPFWSITTINLFTGLVLYLFENAKKEEINLSSVYNLSQEMTEEMVEKYDKTSAIYANLAGTYFAATETKESILSVFSAKFKKYVINSGLAKILSNVDLDLNQFQSKKMALYIISNMSPVANSIVPLIVDMVTDSLSVKNSIRMNILLDDFGNMIPLNEATKLISFSRGNRIKIIAFINSYRELVNNFGVERTEVLKSCFANTIYMYSTDIDTLKEISENCGLSSNGKDSLITVEELKTIKCFEAIVLIPRMYPFKTVLEPDYKINWNYTFDEEELKNTSLTDPIIFKIK